MEPSILTRSGISLERLRSLLVFADAGSIVRAADGDPVRSSLISRQLGELEKFFEVELVAKKGKGLILTEEGKRLTALVREQFQALEDFGKSTAGKSVRLSLGAGNTILEWLVAPRLGPAAMEGVEFDLHHERQAEMIAHLQEGSLDLAIIAKEPLGRQFATAPLGAIEYALYIPKKLGGGSALRNALRQVPLALPIGGRVRDAVIKYAGELQAGTLGTSGYLQRTEWNTRDSDATLIFTMGASLSGGSKRTAEFARKHKKPFLHIFLGSEAPTPAHIAAFIRENHVTLLNVAGSRGSKEPKVHGFTLEVLQRVFDLL